MAQVNHYFMTKQGCFQNGFITHASGLKAAFNLTFERCDHESFEVRFRVNVRDSNNQELNNLECPEVLIINVYEKPRTVLFRKGHELNLTANGRFMYCFPHDCDGWEATYSLLMERVSNNKLILNPSLRLVKDVLLIPDESDIPDESENQEEPALEWMKIEGPSIDEIYIIYF